MTDYQTVLERYENEPRIAKIGMAHIFTNSEKLDFGCKRLWAYSYNMVSEHSTTPDALLYGIAWHLVCEHALNEIQANDTMITVDRGLELVEQIGKRFLIDEQMAIQAFDVFEFIDDCVERMNRAIKGWLPHWATKMHTEYEIIATELVVAAPVFVNGEIGGDIFTGNIRTRKDRNGYLWPFLINDKTPHYEQDCTFQDTPMPYWRAGKIDVLVRRRNTKALYIVDHKTSSSPNGYARKFEYEQQLQSYAALMTYEIEYGELQHLKGHTINGVIWDIAHSKIGPAPEPLKSGKLSTAKGRCAPSWMFEQAIIDNNLDRNDYLEHIEYCKQTVDHSYFQILTKSIDTYQNTIGLENRCQIRLAFAEDYATAIAMDRTRRELIDCDDFQFQIVASRYPKCSEYLNCKFSHWCLPNTPLTDLWQDMTEKGTKIYWKPLTPITDSDNLNLSEDNNYKLPF